MHLLSFTFYFKAALVHLQALGKAAESHGGVQGRMWPLHQQGLKQEVEQNSFRSGSTHPRGRFGVNSRVWVGALLPSRLSWGRNNPYPPACTWDIDGIPHYFLVAWDFQSWQRRNLFSHRVSHPSAPVALQHSHPGPGHPELCAMKHLLQHGKECKASLASFWVHLAGIRWGFR